MSFQLKTPREPMNCRRCNSPLPLLRYWNTYECDECIASRSPERRKSGGDAHKMVSLAVRLGYLKPVSSCACVDCGAPAEHYDHRDYNKPMEVEPVCRVCNYKRGPALLRSERS